MQNKTEMQDRIRRFNLSLKILGWDGGTVFQVNRELKVKCIYELSPEEFTKVLLAKADQIKKEKFNRTK